MLHPRVDGVWLRSIGPWAGLNASHVWPHGCEQANWQMPPGLEHFALHGGALVELFEGGIPYWHGRLSEPSSNGQFAANGSWSEAAGQYAIDGSGAPTNVPDVAIDAAIARGAVTWTRPASLSAAAWGTAGEPLKLIDLLDQAMIGLGLRWYVDPYGAVRAAPDPTTPTLHVPRAAAGHGLALAEDNYYSHLVGSYLSGPGTFATVTWPAGPTDASIRWGRKEARVDLTGMGIITAPTATAQLASRLALTGARQGFAESLELGRGQVTTSGGTAVSLTTPRAGQMLRLVGIRDRTQPAETLPSTDIVIGRSVYADGAATVRLDPVGKADRNLEELLKGAA